MTTHGTCKHSGCKPKKGRYEQKKQRAKMMKNLRAPIAGWYKLARRKK